MSDATHKYTRFTRRRIVGFAGALAVLAVCLTVVSTSGAAGRPADLPSRHPHHRHGAGRQAFEEATSTGTHGHGPWRTITYGFQWQRCNPDSTACADIIGATSQTYTVGSADVSNTLRSNVSATDTTGTATQASATTAKVTSVASLAPVNTAPPTITGTPASGQTLTAGNGTWTGATPLTYTYAWLLCDATGAACQPIAGATGPAYVLTTATIGKSVRLQVTASNTSGTAVSASVPTAVIAAAGPVSLVKLPNGLTSVDAADVKLPYRLILSKFKVQQTQPLHSAIPRHQLRGLLVSRGSCADRSVVSVPRRS